MLELRFRSIRAAEIGERVDCAPTWRHLAGAVTEYHAAAVGRRCGMPVEVVGRTCRRSEGSPIDSDLGFHMRWAPVISMRS